MLCGTVMPVINGTERLQDMNVDQLLSELDRTLDHKDDYVRAKNERIGQLRKNLASATDREQRYWIYRDLYNEYAFYDSDSAIYYAGRCLSVAGELGRGSWADEANMNLSYLYAATGLLEESANCLNRIDVGKLSQSMAIQYYEKLLFLFTHKDQYIGDNTLDAPYTKDAESLLYSMSDSVPPTDPFYYWFRGWRSLNSEDSSRVMIPRLQGVLETSGFETRMEAMDAYMLGRLYDRVGDEDNKLRYLILSAIADARACNREIASLEEIADFMYNKGELYRANEYINYCIQWANDYKSRVRVGRLANLQNNISKAYQREKDAQQAKINSYMWMLVAILVVLLCALAFIILQMRRLRQSRRALNDANIRLNGHVGELQQLQAQLRAANEQLSEMYSSAKQGAITLSETNYAKERYIADIFAICSNYINKLDEFRKKINRMIMAGRFDEVRELTKSPELSHGELKELYANFDEIFLKIYPDFVSDFNSLLRPDE